MRVPDFVLIRFFRRFTSLAARHVFGNRQTYDPERSLSYNLSADYYGKKVRVSTNIFRTDLWNKIGFTDADEHCRIRLRLSVEKH